VSPHDPIVVRWTAHALVRADSLGIARRQLEDELLSAHVRRRRNPREADWLVDFGPYRLAYNHPAEGDETVALVVTVWRRT